MRQIGEKGLKDWADDKCKKEDEEEESLCNLIIKKMWGKVKEGMLVEAKDKVKDNKYYGKKAVKILENFEDKDKKK